MGVVLKGGRIGLRYGLYFLKGRICTNPSINGTVDIL